MRNIRNRDAVSEVFEAVLLLAIAVSIFSVIYLNVLSDPGPAPEAYVTIIGKMESGDVVLEHRRGESLGLDTKVIFSIGGIRYSMILDENPILDNESQNDSFWNIGERVVFKDYNTTNLQVEATVVDIESNSIVMWGRLQEGALIESQGAVWHFDENGGGVAHDSLNNNTGWLKPNAIYGPTWDSDNQIAGASSLDFDGINDYILVEGNSVSLDIKDEITVESWVKFPEDHALHNFTFGPNFGYQPNIINIYGDTYAVVYKDQGHHGVIKTVNIASDGTFTQNIHNNSFTYSNKGFWPKITHVSEDIYLIVYSDSGSNPNNVYLETIKILNNGTIFPTISEYAFGDQEVYDYDMLRISDDIIALVFRNQQNQGLIKTINVSQNGSSIVTDLENGTLIFDDWNCFNPDIVHVVNDTYAIAYKGNDSQGYLKTIEIANNGTIHDTVIDSHIFESINASDNPDIIHIADNIFSIVYKSNTNGIITTVEISDTGYISNMNIDSLLFEDNLCNLPDVIHMKDDIYLIAYESDQQDGYVTVINIKTNGSISDNIITKIKINTGKTYHGAEPDIIRVSDVVYAIAFRSGSKSGSPHEGHLITGRLSLYDDSNFSNNPYLNRALYKKDSYGIYVNKTHIAANIGNNFVNLEISVPEYWNHVVLTYDGLNIVVYLNGAQIISESYDSGLVRNTNDILIGNLFYGSIDEVAIYDRALTEPDVQNHYNNPGYTG
jgi:hypothetical protein